MQEEKTYLELSEAEGSSHKFYEVVVQDTQVTIRYGRIGDAGQSKTTSYPTPEKAQAEATKKINEKLKKGYAPAVMGMRQKRPVTRREVVSQVSTAQRSPILWQFKSKSAAFGIFVDEQRCWMGNQTGEVFAVNHQGELSRQFKLPDGVKCIVADDAWLYAGCDDGNVYDLTGKLPRLAYEIDEKFEVLWLDVYGGTLAIADINGGLTTVDSEDESQWTRLSKGDYAWMVRSDRQAIYHGHSHGVTAYDYAGTMLWQQRTKGAVLFGWQETDTVYAATSSKKIQGFAKDGTPKTTYQCDSSVYSCATAEGGKYVFAGDDTSSIYCFEESGKRLWKLGTGCGSALSMQWFGDRIYIVTTDGTLACIDASESAIQSAQEGIIPQAVTIQAPKLQAVSSTTELETTTNTQQGVILECFKEGSQLRMRVISPGYHADWKVQFPKNIREAGAQYLVEEVRVSSHGEFYRAYGEIKRLV